MGTLTNNRSLNSLLKYPEIGEQLFDKNNKLNEKLDNSLLFKAPAILCEDIDGIEIKYLISKTHRTITAYGPGGILVTKSDPVFQGALYDRIYNLTVIRKILDLVTHWDYNMEYNFILPATLLSGNSHIHTDYLPFSHLFFESIYYSKTDKDFYKFNPEEAFRLFKNSNLSCTPILGKSNVNNLIYVDTGQYSAVPSSVGLNRQVPMYGIKILTYKGVFHMKKVHTKEVDLDEIKSKVVKFVPKFYSYINDHFLDNIELKKIVNTTYKHLEIEGLSRKQQNEINKLISKIAIDYEKELIEYGLESKVTK